jgi:biotin-dependent carboxylase-like uncharacterized protein
MAARIRVLSSGVCSTIQDAGRIGHLRNGVSNSGPMDWISFALAVKLACAPSGGAAIEVSVGGLELEVLDGEVQFGLAGGAFSASVNGNVIQHPACVRLRPLERLSIKTTISGAWFYVAPSAPMDIDPVLGSFATHARYAIGPAGGKRLQPADEIGLREDEAQPAEYVAAFPHLASRFPIRVTPGPQIHMFDEEEVAKFFSAKFVLSERVDRMAYVLDGPRITPSTSYAIATEGTALGSVQIAGDGSPYVLMSDRSSMGGYPKIATIIRADIGRFAQKRPGETIEFQQTSFEAAISLLRELKQEIAQVSPARRQGWFDLEALILGAGNSGVVDALSCEQ